MIPGLNLLPADRKQLVSVEETISRWRSSLILMGVVSLILAGLALAAHWNFQLRAARVTEQLKLQQTISEQQGGTDISLATTKVNEEIALLSRALPISRHWDEKAQQIVDLFPAKTTLTKIVIDIRGRVTIEGVAETRASFMALGKIMSESKVLKNATTNSTASLPKNLPFIYTATLPD